MMPGIRILRHLTNSRRQHRRSAYVVGRLASPVHSVSNHSIARMSNCLRKSSKECTTCADIQAYKQCTPGSTSKWEPGSKIVKLPADL